jgi:putative redox protein
MMAKIILRQVEQLIFVGTDSNNHSVTIGKTLDQPPVWVGAKPSELLLMAAASCSAFDVVEILIKQRQPYRDLVVTCNGEQLPEPPSTYTHIHLHYQVHGEVDPEKLERAIQLSMEKYCSVITTIRPDTPVTHDFEILP